MNIIQQEGLVFVPMAASSTLHPNVGLKQEIVQNHESQVYCTSQPQVFNQAGLPVIGENKENFTNGELVTEQPGQVVDANGQAEEPVIDINVNNVVCTFNMRCHINLKKLAMEGSNVEYRRSHGVSYFLSVLTNTVSLKFFLMILLID